MQRKVAIAAMTLGLWAVGCQKPPPPAPAAVPGPYTEQERAEIVGVAGQDGPIVRYDERGSFRRPVEPVQPNPPRHAEPPAVRAGPPPQVPLPPPPPIVQEELPEQQAFVRAYRGVGSPKVAVVVYRSADPADPFRDPNAPPPAAGPLADRAIDYRALELSLADWLASAGQVSIRSSTQLPAPPKPEEVDALRQGNDDAAASVRQNTGVDVLVVVWAEVTRQAPGGLDIRLVSEAIYLSDAIGQGRHRGDSIARTFVDMPPRMQADTLAITTRQIARELMLDMSRTWDDWLARP